MKKAIKSFLLSVAMAAMWLSMAHAQDCVIVHKNILETAQNRMTWCDKNISSLTDFHNHNYCISDVKNREKQELADSGCYNYLVQTGQISTARRYDFWNRN